MALAALALPGPASAESAGQVVTSFETAVERTRLQSRAVLLALAELERRHADPAAAGASVLAPAAALVRIFERSRDAARELEGRANERLRAASGDREERAELSARVGAASRQLDKHQRYVGKFWGDAIRRFGEPPPPATIRSPSAPVVARVDRARLRLSGQAQAGLGTSSFEQPETDPRFEESTTLLNGRLDAEATLTDGTRVTARLSQEKRVERLEITLSDIGVGVSKRFEGGLSVRAGVGRAGYDEELNKPAGFGETVLHANADYAPGPTRVSVGVNRRSRSYDEDDPLMQNFDITALEARAEMQAGEGTLAAGITRTDRDGEVDATDYTILNPQLIWTSRPGGSELHASLERFDAPDSLDADTDRLKLRFKKAHGTREHGGRVGPEVLLYRFPDREGAGHSDYGLAGASWRRVAGETRQSGSRWRAYFRNFESDGAFDFVAFSGSRDSRPRQSGFLYSAAAAGKLFVDANDFDALGQVGMGASSSEVLAAIGELIPAFDTTREPHVLDAHLRFGWLLLPASRVVRSVEITPSLGHALYVDTERDDLQGKADELTAMLPDSLGIVSPLGDDDFLWRNTINRARLGARVALGLEPAAGAAVHVALQYDVNRFYNAEPVQNTTSLDLNLDGRYPLRARLTLEGRADYHKASFGDGASSRDFDRVEIALSLRYVFDDLRNLGSGSGS